MAGVIFIYGMNKKMGTQYSPLKHEQSTIETPIPRALEAPLPNTLETPVSRKHPLNILVLGLDGEKARTDVITLLNFNPQNDALNILSVTRDTRVMVRNKASKINALMAIGGEKLLIKEVEKLTGLTVDYYAVFDFEGFRKAIDAVDGVEINIPFNMDYDDPEQNLHIHLKKGFQTLDGAKAEQLVRYRKGNTRGQGYIDGDVGRVKMQQELLKALIQQKFKVRYISRAYELYSIIRKYVKSDIEAGRIGYIVSSIKDTKYDNINLYTLPGDSAYIDNLWYFIYDENKTRELIEHRFYK